MAQYRVELNDVTSADNPDTSVVYGGPLMFAQETLPVLANSQTGRRGLELEANLHVAVKPRRAIRLASNPESVYLRIDLSGAHFGGDPSLIQGTGITTADPPEADPLAGALGSNLSSGGDGESFAVLELTTNDVAAANMIAVVIPNGGAVADPPEDLQMAITTGSATATIASYSNPDDALDQVNPTSTFGGSGTIIRLQSGLTVTIMAADNPVASVDHAFRWFVKTGRPPVTGQARLGWLGVEENIDATAGLRNAMTGAPLANTNILDGDARITFDVMGNLDIGAFTIQEESYDAMTPPNPTGMCEGVDAGSVDQGTLEDADGMKLINEDGDLPSGVTSASSGNLMEDTYLLCLNVDVTGPETNMDPIPPGDYTATAYTRATATADPRMVGEGDLASIVRNGASVEIPYLTTSEKHNQRLIVVNRGTRPAAITSIQFTTEEDVAVELMAPVQAAMDAGLLVVPANSSWVARMDETISITYTGTPKLRVAASLAFAATPGAISVATTQVNISDGSTDTVVYEVK